MDCNGYLCCWTKYLTNGIWKPVILAESPSHHGRDDIAAGSCCLNSISVDGEAESENTGSQLATSLSLFLYGPGPSAWVGPPGWVLPSLGWIGFLRQAVLSGFVSQSSQVVPCLCPGLSHVVGSGDELSPGWSVCVGGMGVWSSIAAFPMTAVQPWRRVDPYCLPFEAPCTAKTFFSLNHRDGPVTVSVLCLSESCGLSSAATGLEIAGGQDDTGDCPQAAHGSEC